jgi:hypothetical protein
MASMALDAQARTDDPYVQPLLSQEGIASALADFDARTAVWVDKCNANGVTEVFAASRKCLRRAGEICRPATTRSVATSCSSCSGSSRRASLATEEEK